MYAPFLPFIGYMAWLVPLTPFYLQYFRGSLSLRYPMKQQLDRFRQNPPIHVFDHFLYDHL